MTLLFIGNIYVNNCSIWTLCPFKKIKNKLSSVERAEIMVGIQQFEEL